MDLFHTHTHTIFVQVSDAPEKLIELIELQHGFVLRSSFKQEVLITFYNTLPVSRFSDLRTLARNLVNVFGSTCTYEQAFSRIKRNK
jgi:hypothetical protein